jgi:hypothetical protein
VIADSGCCVTNGAFRCRGAANDRSRRDDVRGQTVRPATFARGQA